MTNDEKDQLRKLCKDGYSFADIRGLVSCSDSTIKEYIKIFRPAECRVYYDDIRYQKDN